MLKIRDFRGVFSEEKLRQNRKVYAGTMEAKQQEKPAEETGKQGYTADSITVLKGLEAVRKRLCNVHWRCWRKRTAPSCL